MRNNTDNINSQCRSGGVCTRKLQSAFTLIEVLTVVLIISLLVAILLPSLKRAKDAARLGASKTSVNMIDAAVEMFENDHNELPPSTGGGAWPSGNGSWPNGWKGAELICLLLTGYADDPGSGGNPDGTPSSANMEDDDGKAGFGFRLNRRGKVYGPYNGTEKLAVGDSNAGNTYGTPSKAAKVFVDAFDNPILYYEYRDTAGTPNDISDDEYVPGDNAGVYTSGDPTTDYLNNAANVRKDFILVSLGTASAWGDELDSEKQPSNFGK